MAKTVKAKTESEEAKLVELMAMFNKELAKNGLLEIVLVSPKDCIPQKVNARYMTPETFKQLIENIKLDGTLETMPLLYSDDELAKEGKYEIISGHHRIDAAKAAGVPKILAFVRRNISREELVSKQLSHNALSGVDNAQILKKLFDSINSIDLKAASGITNGLEKLSYETLKFKAGKFKTFVILFAQNDLEAYDELAKEVMAAHGAEIKEDSVVRIADVRDYDKFIVALQRLKKITDIKSNAMVFSKMTEIMSEFIENHKEKENV
jgi:hypothetical protein